MLALPLLVAVPGFAQDTDVPKASEPNSITLGLGAAMAPSYEGSDDYIIVPAGLAFGKVGGFAYYTRATTLYVDVLRDPYDAKVDLAFGPARSEEHTSELQSLMRISYAVFCLKKKKNHTKNI